MDLWRLVAHRHWFTLRIFGREVRLCARCSGYVVGFFILTVFHSFFVLPFIHSLKVHLQLFFCFLLIIPLTYDWITQSWGWRESNNVLRLITGAILGIGVSLLSSIEAMPYLKMLFYIYTATVIALFGSVGKLLSEFSSRSQRV